MRYTVSADATTAMVDDGAVVLNMRTKRYYSLNESGAVVWQMLEHDGRIAPIVACLVARYDVDEATASLTVTRLVEELCTEALLVRAR